MEITAWVKGSYRKYLIGLRTKTEEDIIQLGQQEAAVSMSDYDTVGEFHQERGRIKSLTNMKFAYLKRINRRVNEIDQGAFTGKCQCGENIEKKILREYPDRALCTKCQIEKNGKS